MSKEYLNKNKTENTEEVKKKGWWIRVIILKPDPRPTRFCLIIVFGRK